jgi:bacteriocin-like protein
MAKSDKPSSHTQRKLASGKKDKIELTEQDLKKVTGGVGSATGGAGAGKIKFNEG